MGTHLEIFEEQGELMARAVVREWDSVKQTAFVRMGVVNSQPTYYHKERQDESGNLLTRNR
jgi:hypothetical protein